MLALGIVGIITFVNRGFRSMQEFNAIWAVHDMSTSYFLKHGYPPTSLQDFGEDFKKELSPYGFSSPSDLTELVEYNFDQGKDNSAELIRLRSGRTTRETREANTRLANTIKLNLERKSD